MRVAGGLGLLGLWAVLVGTSSCGSTKSSTGTAGTAGRAGGGANAGASASGNDAGAEQGGTHSGAAAGSGGASPDDSEGGAGGADNELDPTATCEGAALRSHWGCEFWPTIVANPVWSEFSPGLTLSNPGKNEASVEITGPSGFKHALLLPPGQTKSVKLAWVPELKGPEWSRINTSGARSASSSSTPAAAYKVISSYPIAAWQYSPLDSELPSEACGLAPGSMCRAATGDASLLLPVTALTGSYRVMGLSTDSGATAWGSTPGAFAVTATRDGTKVLVQLAPRCGVQLFPTTDLGPCTAAGDGVASKMANDIYTFDMNAGDVLTLAGAATTDPPLRHADLSGTVINADQPVQVIAFTAAANVPDRSVANADHLEETVPPAESFGKKYVVMPPSAPVGSVGHVVRIYGNVDGTALSYPDGKPAGAPDVINAGEVAQIPPPPGAIEEDCTNQAAHCLVSQPFTVEGSQPFGVASFLPGGSLLSPGADPYGQGDPGASWVQAPEQFRQSYLISVPGTATRVADVLAPTGAKLFLDGTALSGEAAFSVGGWQQYRVELVDSNSHQLTTDAEQGMSVQLLGYSLATGYYYPAGGNFKLLSEPPIVIR